MGGGSESFNSLWLTLTYRCTVACRHCIVDAAPYKRDLISPELARYWLIQTRAYRAGVIREVAFTGGEPFYNVQLLRSLSDFAAMRGFQVTVVTNAFWASSSEDADRIIKSLPAVSLLAVSTDEYHQKSIPIDHVRNAVDAARTNGRLVRIEVCADSRRGAEHQALMAALAELASPSEIRVHLAYPAGRAQCYSGSFHYTRSTTPADSPCPLAGAPAIFPDGRVFGCIGPVIRLPGPHPLLLGNLREEVLSDILERADANPMLRAIRVWGPKRLVSLVSQAGMSEVLPSSWIRGSPCDVCCGIFGSPQALGVLETLHAVRTC